MGLSKQTLNQVFTHHSHYKLNIASIGTEWLWWHVRKFCRRICLMVLRQLGKRKDSACNAGDPGLISGSGRFPGEGDSYLLYSCLENPRDRGAWRVIGSHRVGHDWRLSTKHAPFAHAFSISHSHGLELSLFLSFWESQLISTLIYFTFFIIES